MAQIGASRQRQAGLAAIDLRQYEPRFPSGNLGAFMRTLLASVALVIGTGFPAIAQAADCAPLRIENSVKMIPGHPARILLPIILNGVQKTFLLDTGGALSTISSAAVKELNLPAYHSNHRLSFLQGQDSTDFVQVHEVILGNAKNSGVQFQVVDRFGPPGTPQPPFDGILATGIFLHDDLDLDFGAGRVNFFSPDHCEGKVVYWPHQALAVVPVKEEQSHIDVPVTLDGHPLRAMIDTGAQFTTMDLSRAQQAINFSPDAPSAGNAPKDNPQKQIYPRRLSNLSFDGVTIQNPLVIIQPLQFGGGKTDDQVLGSRAERKDDAGNRLNADITIGMDILRHLHIYFASRESRLYITEAEPGESVLFKSSAPAQAAAPAQ